MIPSSSIYPSAESLPSNIEGFSFMPVLLNQRERHGGFPVHAGQLALTVLGFSYSFIIRQ